MGTRGFRTRGSLGPETHEEDIFVIAGAEQRRRWPSLPYPPQSVWIGPTGTLSSFRRPILGAMFGAFAAGIAVAQSNSVELIPDPATDCGSCADRNQPQMPFRVFGNTYYVGPAGLSSILIASEEGLALLDGRSLNQPL